MLDISICTACMNREELLSKALETWLDIPVKEIIIVDWNSTVSLHTTLFDKFKDDRIKIIRVDGKSHYNQSKASNLKVRASTCSKILSIDCDIKLNRDFFKHHDSDNFYYGNMRVHPGTTGTCLMTREMFLSVNGYNEIMEGWGYHDTDFYNRLTIAGYSGKFFDHSLLEHIEHDDSIRVQNYEIKRKMFSNHINKKIAKESVWGINNKMESQEVTIYSNASITSYLL